MRIPFLPRSLYARIVVLVCIVLVVAQVLSMLLLFDERARWFLQSRVNRSTQRIADAVRVLDQQPAERRAAVAAAFAAPGFQIVTSSAAPSLP
ncbi:MAG TPA: hypothetical protein VJM11_17680, partial [Nevskiaceae bacterium]|nr:hypothetical protein [Nevskiaceae bacterium]